MGSLRYDGIVIEFDDRLLDLYLAGLGGSAMR